jgi:hypothetical protein
MKLRHKRGGTLGLVAAVALMLVFVGFCIYWVAQILGGGKQVANATDAGAITAAKELEAVTIDVTAAPGLIGTPVELEGLGVDTKSGAPNPATTQYNIYAYNRAVGAAILMCANAEAEGTGTAISNAQTIVTNLQAIGNALTQQLNTSLTSNSPPSVFNAFQTTAYSNNVSMMGPGAGSIATVTAIQPGWVGSTDAAGNQAGKANVYFNSGLAASFIGTHLPPMALGGVTSNTSALYSGSLSGAQAGQQFVPGYTKIDYSAGINGPPIPGATFYAVAVNPDQFPHLVDINRFANGATSPDGAAATLTNVPFNSVQGTTQAQETSKTNMFASALASAVIGTANNMYPVTLGHGFVLLSNDHSYKYNAIQQDGAASIASPPALDQWPTGSSNSNIFNAELYEDTAVGGGGAIDTFSSSSAQAASAGGEVFGVEAGPTKDASYPNLVQQMATWWSPYLASNTTTYPGGLDKYGRDPYLDPTGGVNGWNGPPPATTIPTNTFVMGGNIWVQNNNARVAPPGPAAPPGTQNIVQATADTMARINGSDTACHDTVYAATPPNPCQNLAPGSAHLTDFQNSYGDVVPSGMSGPPDGTSTGGLTSLEYLKGLVITAYEDMIQSTGYNPTFAATIPSARYQYPAVKSGSHVYSRLGVPYAQPSNTPTIEFGSSGTPFQLLNQIVDGSADPTYAANSSAPSCPGNIDLSTASPLWNNNSSIQGQLLQRVLELDPTYTSTKMAALLNSPGSQIDLGWSDVIYWDTTANAVVMKVYNPSNASTLAAFPTWLQSQLTTITSAAPSSYLDGTATPLCGDEPWNATASKNQVNGTIGVSGNGKGDLDLHDAPFMTGAGTLNSQDGAIWTANSGKGGLLGQLLFQQNTNAGGTAGIASSTFSGPN